METNRQFLKRVFEEYRLVKCKINITDYILYSLNEVFKQSSHVESIEPNLSYFQAIDKKRADDALILEKALELLQGRYLPDESVDEFLSADYVSQPLPYGLSIPKYKFYKVVCDYLAENRGLLTYNKHTGDYIHYTKARTAQISTDWGDELVGCESPTRAIPLTTNLIDIEYILGYINIDILSNKPILTLDARKSRIEKLMD